MKKNVILDVDTGIDDALAIMYVLGHDNAKIRLISCVYGNSSVEMSTKNTLDVLNLAKKTEIPVAMGEHKPLLTERDTSIQAHGESGIGEYVFPKNNAKCVPGDGIEVLNNALMQTKGKTTIFALGPLTNIAKLLHVYPEVKKKIKQIVVSGGLLVDNKRKPYIGFNIALDAYAVELVFNSKIKTIICPSDMGHRVYLDKEDQASLGKINKSGKEFKEILKYHKDRHVPHGLAATHDLCAVACVLDKKLFKFENRYIYLRKVRSAGKAIIDFDAKLKKKHIKARVVCDVDVNGLKQKMFNYWKKLP